VLFGTQAPKPGKRTIVLASIVSVIGSNALAAVPPHLQLRLRRLSAITGRRALRRNRYSASLRLPRDSQDRQAADLVGQPGTEIRGSDVWSGWVRSGRLASADQIPALPSVAMSTAVW